MSKLSTGENNKQMSLDYIDDTEKINFERQEQSFSKRNDDINIQVPLRRIPPYSEERHQEDDSVSPSQKFWEGENEKEGNGFSVDLSKEEEENIIKKISADPFYFKELSLDRQENEKLITEAVKPNSDGIYSHYSFDFAVDKKENVNEEIMEIERTRRLFQESFPKFEELQIVSRLGVGVYGRAYLIRIPKNEENSSENRTFVAKIYQNLYINEKKEQEIVKKDCLMIPYHRNVVPIIHSQMKYEICTKYLPDYESYWKEELEERIKTSIVIMKYHRKDLSKYVEERIQMYKPFRNLEFCYILRGILRGAKFLHQNLVVHRDLHPGNILIDEVNGRVLIGDFGCSLDLRMNLTGFKVRKTNEILFSYQYSYCSMYLRKGGAENFLAPEILNNDEEEEYIDYSKSDLYSCGLVGIAMIKFFFSDDFSLDNVKEEFISKKIIGLIKNIVIEDPSERIGYLKAVGIIEEITKFFEKERGEISYDFDEKEKLDDLNLLGKQSTKYFYDGINHSKYGKYLSSIKCFEKSLEIEEKYFPNNYWRIYVRYYNIANSKQLLQEISSSLDDFYKCLEMLLKYFPHKYEHISDCHNQIGFLYLRNRKYGLSKNSFENSLGILLKHSPQDQKKISESYGYLASYYQEIKDFPKSIEYYQKCLQLQEKLISNPKYEKELIRIDLTYFNIAIMFDEQEKYSESLNYYQKSLKFGLLPKNHPHNSNCYNNMGCVYLEFEEYSKALNCFKECLTIRLKYYPKVHQKIISVYKNIGFVYEKGLNDNEKALEYYSMGLPVLQEHMERVKKKLLN